MTDTCTIKKRPVPISIQAAGSGGAISDSGLLLAGLCGSSGPSARLSLGASLRFDFGHLSLVISLLEAILFRIIEANPVAVSFGEFDRILQHNCIAVPGDLSCEDADRCHVLRTFAVVDYNAAHADLFPVLKLQPGKFLRRHIDREVIATGGLDQKHRLLSIARHELRGSVNCAQLFGISVREHGEGGQHQNRRDCHYSLCHT